MGFAEETLLLLFILSLSFVPFQTCSAQKTTYIVHMDTSLMPTNMATHHQWYTSVLHSAKLVDTSTSSYVDELNPSRLLYAYSNVLDGFSAVLSMDELESLKKTTGFLSAYPDKTATLDTTHTFESLSLNPHTGLWPASEYGKDVIVGVIDTGVWPESPSFKDDGMADIPKTWKGICQEGEHFSSSLCNKKLIGVRYFNKGLTAALPNTTTIYMNSGRDVKGHGTHTSSTAAGNYVEGASFFGYATGVARGMAPRARVAVYKASWQEGTYSSDILAAMDQAVADGVDVISLSLGLDNMSLYEDPIAIASFGAMEKGVLVSTSAGNDGPAPLGMLRNGIPWVLTTAASSIDRWFGGTLYLGNGNEVTGWTTYPARAIIHELPLVYNSKISSCNSTRLLSKFTGSIVICQTENITSLLLQSNVVAGSMVRAAIFISDDLDILTFTYFPYPGVVISRKESYGVIKYAQNGVNPYASMHFQQTLLGTKGQPGVAPYSSRGPAPSFPGILKPDLMAPGTLVLAAWIPNSYASYILPDITLSSPFNLDSGTSMACPHSSGIAALLKGAHPDWSPAAIRSAMITTANPSDNTGAPIKDPALNYSFASPLSMGAGQVDPNQALNPGLIYDATPQDYVNLLCSMNFTLNQIRTITRSGASKYTCSNPSSDINYPSFILLYTLNGTVTKTFKRTVTYVGDGQETYAVDASHLPKSFHIGFSTRKLTFKNKHDTADYTFTLTYKGSMRGEVEFGSLTWVGSGGKHKVRSPVVVAPMIHTW